MTQPAAAPKKKGFFLVRYFSEILNELKKVVWLSRKDVIYLTGMVLTVTVIASAVLGTLDYAFSQLVSRLFIGQ
jgi:preprotein translocase subunit SecE